MIDYSASELEEIRRKIRNKRICEWVQYVGSVVSVTALFVVFIIVWENWL